MNFQIVIDALVRIFTDIVNFLPNLVNGLIILIVGYLIARIVRWVLRAVLGRLRFDPLVERTGITGALRGLGVKVPLSTVVAQTIFALLLLSFLITATRLMGLEAVAQLLEGLLLFLPNLISALIIFLLGGIVAQFAGGLAGSMATSGGIAQGARVGRFVQYTLSVFVVVLALSELGIDTAILVTAMTLLIAAFALALALALGLGGRTIVLHILAGYYLRQRFAAGSQLAMGDVRGSLQSVGSVNTVLATEAGEVVVPNNTLLEAVVHAA